MLALQGAPYLAHLTTRSDGMEYEKKRLERAKELQHLVAVWAESAQDFLLQLGENGSLKNEVIMGHAKARAMKPARSIATSWLTRKCRHLRESATSFAPVRPSTEALLTGRLSRGQQKNTTQFRPLVVARAKDQQHSVDDDGVQTMSWLSDVDE
ncbi:hypothetical protein MMC32_003195 [Xylographa parallela]|nr:hypothetical protein [Xylographa parallela]